MKYETIRNTPTIGAAPVPRVVLTGAGKEHKGGLPTPGRLFFRRLSLAGSGTARRRERTAGQTHSRSSTQVGCGGIEKVAAHPSQRGLGLRLPQRPLDFKANRRGNPQDVWGAIPSPSRLAHPAQRALVLPSTRTPRRPARRRCHCTLEALPVAPDKKKPKDLGPIWSFSMKAASCLSPPGGVLGDRRAVRPSFGTVIGMTASRPWVPLPCPPSATAWAFTCASNKTISKRHMWPNSCGTCCVSCGATSSCFGMVAGSTGARKSSGCATLIRVCMWSRFPSTRPNSIRPNKSGMILRDAPPTVCSTTNKPYVSAYTDANGGFVVPNSSWPPLSWLPIFPRHRGSVCITCAKLNNSRARSNSA
jgi:hypothetical protein